MTFHTTSTSTYFPGFSWAVPLTFQTPIERCRFEEGDAIYNTKDAYLEWHEALQSLKWGIDVKFPKSISEPLTEEEGSVFARNWYSSVTFELINYQDAQRKELITTTQGRLYSLLRTGNFEFLDGNIDHPPLPILPLEAHQSLEEIADHTCFKGLCSGMERPHLFIMVTDPFNPTSCRKLMELQGCLREYQFKKAIFSPIDLDLPNAEKFGPTIYYAVFAIDTRATEKLRDCFKRVLYKPSNDKKTEKECFRLRRHGLFVPFKEKAYSENLITISFKHGNNNFYRFHVDSLRLKKTPQPLQEFMQSLVIGDCPNHFFFEEPRSSKLRIKFLETITKDSNNNIISHAKSKASQEPCKLTHEILQRYLLDNDSTVIACEVPLWMDATEYTGYKNLFPEGGVLTGHVDLLQFTDDGTIWIWDYKPDAAKERYAAGQIYSYAAMLSCRTGLPLSSMRCGYFDASDAFIFAPEQVSIDSTFEVKRRHALNSNSKQLTLEIT